MLDEVPLMRLAHILSTVVAISLLCACAPATHRVIRNPELDHWDGRRMRYRNLFPPNYGYMSETEYDRIDFRLPHERKTRTYRLVHNPKGDIDRSAGYDGADYTIKPDIELLRHPAHDIQITWLRHASFLIQLGTEYQILVDPVLEQIDGTAGLLMKYADTFELHAEAPLVTEKLPAFDPAAGTNREKTLIVAISHDHYDHLNWNTLEKLPADTHFYVPLELERDFPSRYAHVTAMDWFTTDRIGGLKISFLPSNHRSGRELNVLNQSLWGGWLFEWKGRRIYFAGDSGYGDLFKELGRRYGPVDVCLLPISAWFQRHYHFAPEDAIAAARDIGCSTFIPWGWGTWIMSYEHLLEPPRRLAHAWQQLQPENMTLRALKMGETYSEETIP
jgi:L-ascorbate metabolism protein UlaG (beta-lactamase superfamily)